MESANDKPATTINEEIINEITKDLASSLIDKTEETQPTSEELSKQETSPESESTVHRDGSGVTVEDTSYIPEDFEDDNTEEGAVDFDDDVNEELLKDLEVGLSEEDRKKLRTEAKELKEKGNELFKSGEFRESAIIYTNTLRICPLYYSSDRAVLYSNRAAAKTKLGLTKSAIEDCTKALELDDRYLKAYLRRAQLYKETEKLDEAFEDYKKVIEIEPYHPEAREAVNSLPALINERNEKLKTEMMSKLKDVGNLLLRPFGLSTDDFHLNQDPNTGGYSISMGKQ